MINTRVQERDFAQYEADTGEISLLAVRLEAASGYMQ